MTQVYFLRHVTLIEEETEGQKVQQCAQGHKAYLFYKVTIMYLDILTMN